jgi:hypothetical protein
VPYADQPNLHHVPSSEGFFDASMFPFLSYVARVNHWDDINIPPSESAGEDSYEKKYRHVRMLT